MSRNPGSNGIAPMHRWNGTEQSWPDPCCWTFQVAGELKGLISGHVDDFVFSGDETCPQWNQLLEQVKRKYKWSDWESGTFTQCGVKVDCAKDGTHALSQESYIEDLKYINVRAHRKKGKHSDTDELEKGQLRALLGGVSWLAQQTAPYFSAETGLRLSEVS